MQLEEVGGWSSGRRGRIEDATGENGVSGVDDSDVCVVAKNRLNENEARAERTQRVARQTMIVGGRGRETTGLKPVCVVIVMDGNRIARAIVPA